VLQAKRVCNREKSIFAIGLLEMKSVEEQYCGVACAIITTSSGEQLPSLKELRYIHSIQLHCYTSV